MAVNWVIFTFENIVNVMWFSIMFYTLNCNIEVTVKLRCPFLDGLLFKGDINSYPNSHVAG